MAGHDFHCARAVLDQLDCLGAECVLEPERQELLDAASAFMGGTLFMGLTCGAFTAGVMALGLIGGEIESSPLRVMRMLALYTARGDWADDSINNFNRSMNRGYRLSEWFVREFGSTQCRAITGCDFSTADGVNKYIDSNSVSKCKFITRMVAEAAQKSLQAMQT
jgi:hypothetical protein